MYAKSYRFLISQIGVLEWFMKNEFGFKFDFTYGDVYRNVRLGRYPKIVLEWYSKYSNK